MHKQNRKAKQGQDDNAPPTVQDIIGELAEITKDREGFRIPFIYTSFSSP